MMGEEPGEYLRVGTSSRRVLSLLHTERRKRPLTAIKLVSIDILSYN
jgi:hypothetical protein